MHACMHDTNGHNHVEAGQTAAYDGYNLVGQSVDPPHAAKIQSVCCAACGSKEKF